MKIIERHFRWGNIQPKLVSEREEKQETYSSEVKACVLVTIANKIP